MSCRSFLILAAVIELVFALWLLISPGSHLAFYGVTPDMGGMQMGRMFGAASTAGAVALLIARDAVRSPALNAVLWGGFTFNGIAALLALGLTLTGQWNAMGWVAVLLRLLLAIGFVMQARAMRPGHVR